MTGRGAKGTRLDEAAVRALCGEEIAGWGLRGKRVLAIVPDHTRTAPIDLMFRVLHETVLGAGATAFDVLIALGTHPPMSEPALNQRLGLTPADRAGKYAAVKIFNHAWNDPAALASIGTISEDEVSEISGGLMRERVDVTINKLALEYDLLLIVGPTFPHEVVGFSGGNKYLFPGLSGQEMIDLTHWLGALMTSATIIGTEGVTPVRALIDAAAALVPGERYALCVVVDHDSGALDHLAFGEAGEAWAAAAAVAARTHVRYLPKPVQRVLSVVPERYDDLWTGAKGFYKVEPVVADGGEVVLYAPHIKEIAAMHPAITQIGYHCRDYFLAHWDRYRGYQRGDLAHSTHLFGAGTYDPDHGERQRVTVTLATSIPPEVVRAANLSFRDPQTIDIRAWEADPDALVVRDAGEVLFRLS
jgi:lactate racemase